MAGSSVRPRLVRLALLSVAVWAIGCTDQQSLTAPNLAQGGGGSGGGPTVRAADPDSGFQNTTIDVRVLGSGFDNGSRAVWALGGDTAHATTKITTNSTRFVKSGELVANITIAADGPLALFDIMVLTSGGKKGIGIEMFEVKGSPFADPPITVTFDDRVGDNITSDGRGSYVDGECGVTATFNLTDARLDPDAGKVRLQEATACGGRGERKVMVAFVNRVAGSPPGAQDGNTVAGTFFKVNEVELITEGDQTVLRSAIVQSPGCAHSLRFNPNLDPQSNYVEVTKNADGTWTVATQAPPNDVAVCIPDEDRRDPSPRSYYHMPFRITVRLK